MVPRVDGARRRQNTGRSAHSDCDLREQQPRGRWASVTPEASPERSTDEEVEARQRGRSPTVLGCGRLELGKRHRSPEKIDDRGSRRQRHAALWVGPGNCWRRGHPGGTRTRKAGAEGRCGSAKRTGMRKTEQETAMDVRYSELKRELKEIKRARQQLKVARPTIARMSQPEIRFTE